MFYKGGAGKDFFITQTCHVRLLVAVFGLIERTHYRNKHPSPAQSSIVFSS
jgi:hypothetical protein